MLFNMHNGYDMITTVYVTRDDGPTQTGESGICYLVTIWSTCIPAVRICDARNVETTEELVYVTWLLLGPPAFSRYAFAMQEMSKWQRSWFMLLGHYWVLLHSRG